MKPNYQKHFLYGSKEYTYIYLANSTNKLVQTNKLLSLGYDANGWIGKEQPFAPIAPPTDGGNHVRI